MAFSRADAAFAAALRTALAKARLSSLIDQGMGPVLVALQERGLVPVSELAALACVPRSTMTGILARMVKRGLARTGANPADGRSIVVALTPKGRGLLPRLRAIERQLDATIRTALPPSEAARFADMLEDLAKAFSTT